MSKVEVRAARAEDYDWIVAVADDWWGASGQLVAAEAVSQSLLFVAEDANGLAGVLVAFMSPSEPELAYLHFVGPDHRRAGLARRLYTEFLGHAQASGCREACAITAPTTTHRSDSTPASVSPPAPPTTTAQPELWSHSVGRWPAREALLIA